MRNEQAVQMAIAEIALLIKGTSVVMFTTRNGEGRLVSRPLAVRSVPFDGGAWFLTALGSRKLRELEVDPRVNLAYVNASNGAYVSIEGRAQVTIERARIAMLWSDRSMPYSSRPGRTTRTSPRSASKPIPPKRGLRRQLRSGARSIS